MPIATRYPPPNVTFEMHDIAEKFRYDMESIDFVHARSISMAVRPSSLIERTWWTFSLAHARASQIRDYGGLLPEVARVLRPGGVLLLAFHVGDETVHLDEWWGQPVSLDFRFFRPEEMADSLRKAGFEVEEIVEREPYPDVEHPSRRAYIFARKPE